MAIKQTTKEELQRVAQSFIDKGHPKVFIRTKDDVPALWVTNSTGKNTRIITVDCPELPVRNGRVRWFTPAMTVAGIELCDAGFFGPESVWVEIDSPRPSSSADKSSNNVPTGLEG